MSADAEAGRRYQRRQLAAAALQGLAYWTLSDQLDLGASDIGRMAVDIADATLIELERRPLPEVTDDE